MSKQEGDSQAVNGGVMKGRIFNCLQYEYNHLCHASRVQGSETGRA